MRFAATRIKKTRKTEETTSIINGVATVKTVPIYMIERVPMEDTRVARLARRSKFDRSACKEQIVCTGGICICSAETMNVASSLSAA